MESAAHGVAAVANEIQTLRAQLATAEKRIQRYNDIIISQADKITVLRDHLCQIPALRAQLSAAEKSIQHYNDLIISQADELTALRNSLCGRCRNKSTPAPAQSPSAPPSRHFQTTPKSLSNSFQMTLEGMRQRWAWRRRLKSQEFFYDPPEAFSAPDTAFSRGVPHAQPKSIPKPTQPPVHNFPKQVTTHWSIANNPTAKSVLRLTFLRSFNFEEVVHCLKFSPDGKYLAVGLTDKVYWTMNGKGFIYHLESGTRTSVLEEIIEKVKSGFRRICFSPNGELLAVGHSDGHISVWSIREKRIRNMFRGHIGSITSVEFSPNGRHIISTAWDHTVRVWSMRDGSSRKFMDDIFTVRFSPDGHYFAAGYFDGSLGIWCLRTGKLMAKWTGYPIIPTLAFMPDGKRLVSGSWDEKISYWDVDLPDIRRMGTKPEALKLTAKIAPAEGKQPILEFDGHLGDVNSLAVSPDGHWILSGSNDKSACIWDARTAVPQCRLLGHTDWIRSVDFSAEGNYLAIGGLDGRVSLWKYGT